jgi:hypothetical protein
MAQYVTPTELAQHLNMRTPDATHVEMLTRAIEAASAQIDGICGRTFMAVSEVRYLTALTATTIDLGYVSEIELIDIDATNDYTYGTPLLAEHYFLTDTRGRRYLQLKSTALDSFPLTTNAVRVTGLFGEEAPPPDVKMATMLQAARLWKRKDAVFGEISNQYGNMRIASGFDQDARQLLKDGGWIAARRLVIA